MDGFYQVSHDLVGGLAQVHSWVILLGEAIGLEHYSGCLYKFHTGKL